MKSSVSSCDNLKKEVRVKIPKSLLIFAFGGNLFMYGFGIWFLLNRSDYEGELLCGLIKYQTLGIILILFGIAFTSLIVIEYHNTYWLITEDELLACNIFRREMHLRWDQCQYVGMPPGKYAIDLICSKHIPERNAKGNVPYDSRWPAKSTFTIP